MPFIDEILKYKSISIVGMEKNSGKTECLNYILRKLKTKNKNIAITSIGIDGENTDQVSKTPKPEIEISENIIFITSEKHYKEKTLYSEIIDISNKYTSLGRLITAKSHCSGKVIFSGPTDTEWLKTIIENLKNKVDLTIVDGALSRLSIASPAITEAMILTTGAVVSKNKKQLIKKTKFVYNLINLEVFDSNANQLLQKIESGIWAINKNNNIVDLEIPSVFLIDKFKDKLFSNGSNLFVAGAVSDKLLNYLKIQKNINEIILIVKDFTKLFVSIESYNDFIYKGGTIRVLTKTKLIAICVNPTSADGFKFDSKDLCSELEKELKIPIYDIKKIV